MDEFTDNLIELTKIPGPTGLEAEVSNLIMNKLNPLSLLEVYKDKMGNIIASKASQNSSKKAKKILFLAHMDEVSMVVTKIQEEFVFFNTVGTINAEILYGQPVKIINNYEKISGIICTPSVHLNQDFKEYWIDIGVKSNVIAPGDPIVFDTKPRWLDDEKEILASKALDNRIGCAILLELARLTEAKDYEIEVIFGFTVQEEIGARGAKYIAEKINPDIVVAVDTSLANDPTEKSLENYKMGTGPVKLGTGPVLRMFEGLKPDKGMFVNFSDKDLINNFNEAANNLNIKCFKDASFNLYTDAAGANESCPDVKSCCIGIPRRYSHSPYEITNLKVAKDTINLIEKYLEIFWS